MHIFASWKSWAALGLLLLMVAALGALAWWGLSKGVSETVPQVTSSVPHKPSDTVVLSPRVVELGGVKTTQVTLPTHQRKLELRGSLAIDSNRLVPVHTRFPGQIMEIAKTDDPPVKSLGITPLRRPLRATDHVSAGQPLAVLWSKDLGEKKSELVGAEANLKLDEVRLSRLNDLVARGSIAEASVREAQRARDLDVIAVDKAERTLRSWSLSEEEIARIRVEADLIHQRKSESNQEAADWARVDILAPIDGTIVEKNAGRGEFVDTTVALFTIADLSVLSVWLHAYEEDLPYLQALPRPIRAEIHLPSNPEIAAIEGTIERIGDIIDLNEHMALLLGSVDNAGGQLKTGQFVSATIDIGNEPNAVEIPATALVDEDNSSYVFVQEDPNVTRFTSRRVLVLRRHFDVVYVRSRLSEAERQRGLHDLHVGELIVSRGALELKEDLSQQQAAGGAQ
jgi:membrane fusion protein, heavy metal efflux system